jgi:hypothetical protein
MGKQNPFKSPNTDLKKNPIKAKGPQNKHSINTTNLNIKTSEVGLPSPGINTKH